MSDPFAFRRRSGRPLLQAGLLGLLCACGAGAPQGTGDRAAGEPGTVSNAPTEADRLTALREEARLPGFELVTAPRPFDFPRDHGPHPEYRHEWWYFTGHLDSAGGEPFGFELTFFRFGLKPPAAIEVRENASAWRASQIYMAHFAVTDIARETFHVAERFSRDALGLAGASAEPFRVSLHDWTLEAGDSPSTWRLVAADGAYRLDLQIDHTSPMMLNGDAGFSRKSGAEGAASYYYSIPRMSARGQLTREGRTFDVQGNVWLDREWGSGSLSSDQQGWDWFALQLDDGSALMFYALRTRDSKRDPHSAGTWLAPDGSMRAIANEEVSIDVLSHWTSPRGVRYPAKWRLRVRSLNLDVEIEPRLADQELDTSTRYWEGACLVQGTRDARAIAGKAYIELVGYGPD
jgi:predicted secreted hydrolase